MLKKVGDVGLLAGGPPEVIHILSGSDACNGLMLLLPLPLCTEGHEVLKFLLQLCRHIFLLQEKTLQL